MKQLQYSVQAKAFQRDVQSIRQKFKADVVGISGQGAESKQKFAQELGLDFSILADENDAVRKEFGVPKAAFGFLPGRVTYVLDRAGVCTGVYDNFADAASHTQYAMNALESMPLDNSWVVPPKVGDLDFGSGFLDSFWKPRF